MSVKKPIKEEFRRLYNKIARIKNQLQTILISTNEISNQILELTERLQILSSDLNFLLETKTKITKERQRRK